MDDLSLSLTRRSERDTKMTTVGCVCTTRYGLESNCFGAKKRKKIGKSEIQTEKALCRSARVVREVCVLDWSFCGNDLREVDGWDGWMGG